MEPRLAVLYRDLLLRWTAGPSVWGILALVGLIWLAAGIGGITASRLSL